MERIFGTKVFALATLLALSASCGQSTNGAVPGQTQDDGGAPPSSTSGGPSPGDPLPDGGCSPRAPAMGAGVTCDAPLAPGTDLRCTLSLGGRSREYLLYAPARYDSCRPAGLVVDAHGSSETDRDQAGLDPFLDWPGGLGSGWRLVADREGFIVVQPQGDSNQWVEGDADFMLALVAQVSKVAKVDPHRVYMTGISNGGGLTYWTGCKDTDVFHGFASVSGYGPQACPLTHPAPLVHFHSQDDKLVSYADGQAAFQLWVKNNHCKAGPKATMHFGGAQSDPSAACLASGTGAAPAWKLVTCDAAAPETKCETWDQCDGGVDATFCTVPGDKDHHFDTTGGHILYINATKLSLAAVAWSYLERPR